MIYRKKYIDELHHLIGNKEIKYIAVVGPTGIGKSTFLHECSIYDIFGKDTTYEYFYLGESSTLPDIKDIKKDIKIVVIDNDISIPFGVIRTFIDSLSSNIRVIFSSEKEIFDEDITMFVLPGLSLREYLEHETGEISISGVLSGEININSLNKLRDLYIENGSSPYCLLSGGSPVGSFDNKRAIMHEELYEKEYSTFDAYLRMIAMNVGNLFKADQIAKLMGISRRKVNKYQDILLRYNIIQAIYPWTENTETDTSRHAKFYFTELGYAKSILGNIHGEGTLKQGIIENLIFLELERKLSDTHTIFFYRKKSGAEITFIAENTTTELITVIEVTTRPTDAIPQVFKVFDEEYHDRVERYMLLNDSKAQISNLNEKQLMILPHVTI